MADVTSQPSKPPVDAFTSLFLSPFKLFSTTTATANATPALPALNAYRQVGVEMVTLATRRTQAMMDMPAKARQCKNSGDLSNVMVEFWQTAWTQQLESASKIAALFDTPVPVAVSKPAPVRDVLDVQTHSADTAKSSSVLDWNNRDRRAA
jgi:hypothetical protein